jgi:hypothetical protein
MGSTKRSSWAQGRGHREGKSLRGRPYFYPEDKAEEAKKSHQIFSRFRHLCKINFNTQMLTESLLASHYDDRAKTLFIWQGVTMYLPAELLAVRYRLSPFTLGRVVLWYLTIFAKRSCAIQLILW